MRFLKSSDVIFVNDKTEKNFNKLDENSEIKKILNEQLKILCKMLIVECHCLKDCSLKNM